MKISDIDKMNESPIGDFETIGDFDRNSSFRDKRDRFLVTNPRSVEYAKKKFENTYYDFDLYFVNTPKGNRFTEIGKVDITWVKDNLGDDVFNAVNKNIDNDAIKVVFTNNKGSARVPMTAWIIAHRISHVLLRDSGFNVHRIAADHLISHTSDILLYAYGFDSKIKTYSQLSTANRKVQLIYKNFWQNVCTFKSARENNLRDWFEAFNELFAQYIITGKNQFNKIPPTIKVGNAVDLSSKNAEDLDYAGELLESLSRDLSFYFDDSMSSSVNYIFVM